MASGDDKEEKGNSHQRTRLLRFCSVSNEDDEDEAKRTDHADDGEKNMCPRFILTNSLSTEAIPDGETQANSQEPDQSLASCREDQQEKQGKRTEDNKSLLPTRSRSTSTINLRTETIPGGELPVHSGEVTSPTVINQASERAMGPHERVALSSSMTDIIFPESFSPDETIYSPTLLSPTIETQGEGIMAASGHRNVMSLSQLHLGNNPSFSHIPETSDPDIDFSLESRTMGSTEGEIASSFSRADPLLQREPSVHTVLSNEYAMEVRDIPVMLANDGDDIYNTCAIDAVLMMILVMILVHQPLSTSLRSSSHVIFQSLWNDVFWDFYSNFDMGAMRRFWANLIDNFPGQNRLDFASRDCRIIEPIMRSRATDFVLQIQYRSCRCRNNYCRYPFIQHFSTLRLVQRFLGRFVCRFNMFYGILNADIIQMALSNFISLPEEVDHRDSCPGVIRTMIQQPPPFFFLDVGDMWMSSENTREQ